MDRLSRLLPVALLLIPLAAMSQTRYVSDELTITFRTGPSTQNAIQRNLTSGARLEVLGTEGDWSHVRLANGDEGWVLTQYLQAEPTAGVELAAATRQLEAATARVGELEARTEQLEAELAATSQALEGLETESTGLESELRDIRSASANALTLRDENEELRRRVSELTSQTNVAEMEIAELRSRERQNWFIVGAAVLLGGVVIGLIAPSVRPKRRSSW